MGIAEEAQKAAQRQQERLTAAAVAAVTKERERQLTLVRERSGVEAAEFLDERDLGYGAYHDGVPYAGSRTYPCYALDDVIVALDRDDEFYLVCTDELLGDYIGPRLNIPIGSKYSPEERQQRTIQALGKAINTAALHPLVVLRDAGESCPTCGREW